MLRTKTHTAAEKPIFFFFGNTICPTAASVSAIYEEHKDEDGFLYMSYAGEDLLSTMKIALSIAGSILREKGTKRLQELPETWLPYLSTLEKMVSISGLEGVLRGGLDGFCGLITCYAEIGDLSWVMKLKEFTN